MAKFNVTLILSIEAETQHDATQIGTSSAEHLLETFNDDGSIGSEIQIADDAQAVVVVEIDAGVVNCVSANKPIRVIILDLDTEGGDEDQIATIDGVETYTNDFEAEVDAPAVADTAAQVDVEIAAAFARLAPVAG